jgi:hypothetical protein
MGKSFDYVPTQLTHAFREAQSNEQFQGWLKMQEAVMEIEFPYDDLPEVREDMFAKESLAVVEQKLLELYDSHRTAFAPENIHTTMRYVYYVGETFRRACEGDWVNVPVGDDFIPAIDFPMREAMIRPADLIKGAVNRRTGKELTVIFGHAERDYREWAAAGKPERTFLGSLRED